MSAVSWIYRKAAYRAVKEDKKEESEKKLKKVVDRFLKACYINKAVAKRSKSERQAP